MPLWVTVAAATFVMGSPSNEPCREYALQGKETQHSVTLTRSFEMAATEVTQEQFEALMGYNPSSHSSCPDCPVETLTWHEAAAYCNELTANANDRCYSCNNVFSAGVSCSTAVSDIHDCPGYRLPTEAEWELAYRAGTTEASYAGPITDCYGTDPTADGIAWFDGNSGGQSQPVGQKQPNSLGLYDMGGNVWEWCQDGYTSDLGTAAQINPVSTDSSRIGRGGAFSERAGAARAATRGWWTTGGRLNAIGFRCARTLN
jgi:formylglycine-generating enzyme required for sulfatase activity